MIEGIPNWVSVPLLILGVMGGAVVMSWIKSSRFVDSIDFQRSHHERKRQLIQRIQKHK